MPIFEQTNRFLQLASEFPTDSLVLAIHGSERFSDFFSYECEVVSTDLHIDAECLLGTNITVTIVYLLEDDSTYTKYIRGVIGSITRCDFLAIANPEFQFQMRKYHIIIYPPHIILRQGIHSRVFQKKGQSTLDVIENVLSYYSLDYDATCVANTYSKELCTQYNETDEAFIKRICALSGYFYYFEHQLNSCKFKLSDQPSSYASLTNEVFTHGSDKNDTHTLVNFQSTSALTCPAYIANNFILEQPGKKLFVKHSLKDTPTIQSKLFSALNNFPFDSNEVGKQYLENYVDSSNANMNTFHGNSAYPLSCGEVITLGGSYFNSMNLDSVVITASELSVCDKRGIIHSPNEAELLQYHTCFQASNSDLAYKPQPPSKIVTPSLQIAQVVDSSGNADSSTPFYNDELGRIAIKFAWETSPDTDLTGNNFDTCFVNVLHSWSNCVYRVGCTVVVDFLNGDIDMPIVIGTINTSQNIQKGKYSTDNVTKSQIMHFAGCDTTPLNNIEFDDKVDEQCITITAAKDYLHTANNTTLNSENYTITIKEKLEVKSDSCRYNSKNLDSKIENDATYEYGSLTQKISGNTEITSSKITIKGDLELNGNLTVKGKVSIE